MKENPGRKNELKDEPVPNVTSDQMPVGSPHPPFDQKPSIPEQR